VGGASDSSGGRLVGRATPPGTVTAVRVAAQAAGRQGRVEAWATGTTRQALPATGFGCPHGQASDGSLAPTGRIDEIKQATSTFPTQTHPSRWDKITGIRGPHFPFPILRFIPFPVSKRGFKTLSSYPITTPHFPLPKHHIWDSVQRPKF
jgi:hypothetical protein